MAKEQKVVRRPPIKKKTTIGQSRLSRPLNKSKRRAWKRYRAQGRKR